jgi:hypothetical protein
VSRLDLNIARLKAQRACLNRAAELIAGLEGPLLELGLGNGRSYDHLREILPGREIFVFEREVAAHPDCIPDEAHLFRGDFRDTLPQAVERFGRSVAFVHADIGSSNLAADAEKAAFVASQLARVVRPGGVIAADRDVGFPGARPLALPEGAEAGRYFLDQVEGLRAGDRPEG